VRWPRLFSKFRLQGGRAGIVTAREGSRVAELQWEMLLGELDMVVYGDQSTWMKPERHSISADDLRRLVGELASDMRINIELDLAGASQVFRGRGSSGG
jgi:hypothetical protein